MPLTTSTSPQDRRSSHSKWVTPEIIIGLAAPGDLGSGLHLPFKDLDGS